MDNSERGFISPKVGVPDRIEALFCLAKTERGFISLNLGMPERVGALFCLAQKRSEFISPNLGMLKHYKPHRLDKQDYNCQCKLYVCALVSGEVVICMLFHKCTCAVGAGTATSI